ncbi:unnamed protein product, partial [Ectocarpus fasciculatus]
PFPAGGQRHNASGKQCTQVSCFDMPDKMVHRTPPSLLLGVFRCSAVGIDGFAPSAWFRRRAAPINPAPYYSVVPYTGSLVPPVCANRYLSTFRSKDYPVRHNMRGPP